jgi:hypothetical protein
VATIENVSGTAFVVAEFRAEENTEPAPASLPASRDLVMIRTKYLDDMAELYRKYWTGRPMTSPIFDFYSVCTLGSDRA